MASRNVLRVNAVEEQASYRKAVAQIILNVQTATCLTLAEIAEQIDVSLGTISNAANKKADLNPINLARLGTAYGPEILDPYLALSGGRGVALDHRSERDILPFMARVQLKIVEARDPAGPGGVREIHSERSGYLQALKDLRDENCALISTIEAELAA